MVSPRSPSMRAPAVRAFAPVAIVMGVVVAGCATGAPAVKRGAGSVSPGSAAVRAPLERPAPAPPASAVTANRSSTFLRPASLAATMSAVRAAGAAGAKVVLLNVWATWCDPCRAELPGLLRFYRENRTRGVVLVLVSADDPEERAEVERVLGAEAAAAGLDARLEETSFIKDEDDTAFVDGLDPRWSGALPATFAFDARGGRTDAWLGPVTSAELTARLAARLGLTPASAGAHSAAQTDSSANRIVRRSR